MRTGQRDSDPKAGVRPAMRSAEDAGKPTRLVEQVIDKGRVRSGCRDDELGYPAMTDRRDVLDPLAESHFR
jgi:hypothetical protein